MTHVWGRHYLDIFLNVCIPNQLGPGNIPALPAGSRYRILTKSSHREEINAHPNIQALRAVIPVDIIPIPELDDDNVRGYEQMNACHRRAVADVNEGGAAILFLSADFVMAADTLATVVRLHQHGARAVVTTGLRLDREAFLTRLAAPGVRLDALSPRELVGMALPYLHAHTLSMFADADPFSLFPVAVYWRVGDEGLVARGLHLHPLMVDPVVPVLPIDTNDGVYLSQAVPDQSFVHVVTDSDELQFFELTAAGREVLPAKGNGASAWRSLLVVATCDSHQRGFWRDHSILIHSRDADGPQWTAAKKAAADYAARVVRLGPHRHTIYKWSKKYGLLLKRRDQALTHAQRAVRQVARQTARSRKQISRVARILQKRLRKSPLGRFR